jgi:hypothetical protein
MERSLLRSQFSTIQRVDVRAVPNLPFDDGIIGLLKLLKQPRLVGSRNAWAGVVADRIYRGSGIIRFRGRYRGARPARARTPRSRAHFPTRRTFPADERARQSLTRRHADIRTKFDSRIAFLHQLLLLGQRSDSTKQPSSPSLRVSNRSLATSN